MDVMNKQYTDIHIFKVAHNNRNLIYLLIIYL